MASNASTSNHGDHGPAMVEVKANGAGPLPRKRGEIGFVEELQNDSQSSHNDPSQGDADAQTNQSPSTSSETLGRTPSRSSQGSAGSRSSPSSTTNSSTSTITKKRPFLYRFRSRHAPPLIFGLQGCSLIRFACFVCLVSATAVGWALTIRHLNAMNSTLQAQSQQPQSDNTNDGSDNGSNDDGTSFVQMQGAMFIFVHVAFALAVLMELIFMERAVFRLRAERWAYLHPGLPAPNSRQGNGIGLAPWNRPPLPTYAAALGFRGTGDVEDESIAPPPPPAYGNTRGSTLLLASVLRNSFRRGSGRALEQVPESRPVSYMSRDEEAEVRSDAERARQLELALARLEEGQ